MRQGGRARSARHPSSSLARIGSRGCGSADSQSGGLFHVKRSVLPTKNGVSRPFLREDLPANDPIIGSAAGASSAARRGIEYCARVSKHLHKESSTAWHGGASALCRGGGQSHRKRQASRRRAERRPEGIKRRARASSIVQRYQTVGCTEVPRGCGRNSRKANERISRAPAGNLFAGADQRARNKTRSCCQPRQRVCRRSGESDQDQGKGNSSRFT